jgi:hypothetical protein
MNYDLADLRWIAAVTNDPEARKALLWCIAELEKRANGQDLR